MRTRCECLLLLALATSAAPGLAGAPTVLGVHGTRFTLNGRPEFLLGISYYGALGAGVEFVQRDLDDMQRHGFNWLRVWATWASFGSDVSAVDVHGQAQEPGLGRLKGLVAECDRRGVVVDVTLSRGAGPGSVTGSAAHRRAVEVLVNALQGHRNWYLDLANERDVGDARYVSTEEIRALRDLARSLAPNLLVTASFGGHDLNEAYLRQALVDAGLDFVAPHRPRDASSPAQTEAQTRACLAAMEVVGQRAPIHYQEPFRRGYGDWQPGAADFKVDLDGAVAGGAAGWCLHNGSERRVADGEPRRSFDLRARRLFEQLDGEERRFVEECLPAPSGGQVVRDVAVAGSGALSVLPFNPHYFRDASGAPVVLIGDYTWGTFSDVDYDYGRFLDSLQARGLNLARIWLWWGCEEITTDPHPTPHIEPYLRPGPGLANDGRPRYDLRRFNPAFFERLRAFCEDAGQRGLQLQLVAMDAWMLKHAELWRLHAFQRDNNINGVDGDPAQTGLGTDGERGFCSMGNPAALEFQKALLRQIVETTNRFGNVHYEIANENYYSAAWELALCDYIKDIERAMPRQHLTLRRDVPLHSDVVQRWEPALVRRGMLERRSLGQPLIFDTDWTINPNDDEVRAAMWTALVSGGHFNYMDDSLEFRLGRESPDARARLHRQIDWAAAFMKRSRPWEMTPDDALVKSGTAYAMASQAELVAYLPGGGSATLDLSGLLGPLEARWYDPLDGHYSEPVVVRGGGTAEFAAPAARDWALRISVTGEP